MKSILVLVTLRNLVFYEIPNQSHDFCPYSQFGRRINATCIFYSFVCHNSYGNSQSNYHASATVRLTSAHGRFYSQVDRLRNIMSLSLIGHIFEKPEASLLTLWTSLGTFPLIA
jgi:hypothetical protein